MTLIYNLMKNSKYIYCYLTAILVASTCANISNAQTKQGGIPRLVVNITIDQLNSDYLEAFNSLYSEGGFKKLLSEGRVYDNAINDFTPVDRASATATISTGATPYYNGIVSRTWLDRTTLRPVFCIDDRKVNSSAGLAKVSARNLLTTTIGDELKLYTKGAAKVFGIAPDREAAVLSAGHAADCAIWIDDNNGGWTTTEYYSDARAPWLANYSRSNSLSSAMNAKKWTPMIGGTSGVKFFLGQEAQTTFNHRFIGNRRFVEYKHSGLVNADITDIALHCQQSNQLGVDDVTDLISLQYFAGLYTSDPLSTGQLELQDTYVRLDKELKRLIETLEQRIGKDKVLFVVSSTGYDDPDNADYGKYNIPTGTVYVNRTSNLLNMYLSSIYGAAQYVDVAYKNQIYLNHKLLENQHISLADILSRSSEFLHMSEGVRDVHTATTILSATDGYSLQLRNAYSPTLSGDIIVEIAPGWKIVNEDTAESNTSTAFAIRFPIIFYGANVKSEVCSEIVGTDRIAPTISKAIRIRAPNGCRSLPLF